MRVTTWSRWLGLWAVAADRLDHYGLDRYGLAFSGLVRHGKLLVLECAAADCRLARLGPVHIAVCGPRADITMNMMMKGST